MRTYYYFNFYIFKISKTISTYVWPGVGPVFCEPLLGLNVITPP